MCRPCSTRPFRAVAPFPATRRYVRSKDRTAPCASRRDARRLPSRSDREVSGRISRITSPRVCGVVHRHGLSLPAVSGNRSNRGPSRPRRRRRKQAANCPTPTPPIVRCARPSGMKPEGRIAQTGGARGSVEPVSRMRSQAACCALIPLFGAFVKPLEPLVANAPDHEISVTCRLSQLKAPALTNPRQLMRVAGSNPELPWRPPGKRLEPAPPHGCGRLPRTRANERRLAGKRRSRAKAFWRQGRRAVPLRSGRLRSNRPSQDPCPPPAPPRSMVSIRANTARAIPRGRRHVGRERLRQVFRKLLFDPVGGLIAGARPQEPNIDPNVAEPDDRLSEDADGQRQEKAPRKRRGSKRGAAADGADGHRPSPDALEPVCSRPTRERLRQRHHPPVIGPHDQGLIDRHREIRGDRLDGALESVPPRDPLTSSVPAIVSCAGLEPPRPPLLRPREM